MANILSNNNVPNNIEICTICLANETVNAIESDFTNICQHNKLKIKSETESYEYDSDNDIKPDITFEYNELPQYDELAVTDIKRELKAETVDFNTVNNLKTLPNKRLQFKLRERKTLELTCEKCNRRFTTSSVLEQHTCRKSRTLSKYCCPQCPKVCKTTWTLTKHMRTHSYYVTNWTENLPMLEIIQLQDVKREDAPTTLTNPKKTPRRIYPKSHKCQICNKKFEKRCKLIRHQSVHTKPARKKDLKPACPLCRKIFTNDNHLRRHLLVHSGEKPFACDFCGRCFNNQSNLKMHQNIHNTSKPYQCHTCNRTFSKRSELRKHNIVHTNEYRKFECQICLKKFNAKSIIRHKFVHMVNKPYPCDLCEKTFASPSHLKRHRNSHFCKICNEVFVGDSNMRVHKLSHNGKPTPKIRRRKHVEVNQEIDVDVE